VGDIKGIRPIGKPLPLIPEDFIAELAENKAEPAKPWETVVKMKDVV